MKKIKLFLLGLLCSCILPLYVSAASGTIGVTGSSTAVVGNKVTVTVTLSSNTAIGSWQMDLNYDKNYLQLTGSTAEGGGTRMVDTAANGTKKKTYTFTFKTLKSGTTRVSVSSYLAYDYKDINEMTLTSTPKSIRIMTEQELQDSYSKDNNLKSLSVEGYELDKVFDKDTLEYTVNVPTGTTSVKITATKNDNTATVSGDGEIEVTEGTNTIPIVVTAQNGSEKTYNILVNVEDQNPISVKLENDKKEYFLVKNGNLLTAPTTFAETKIMINEIEIPGFVNNTSKIKLVGLKDSEGNIVLAIYDNGKYKKFNEIISDNYHLIPTKIEQELSFERTEIKINDEKIEAYKINNDTDIVIISAKNLDDGKTSLYLYDTKEKTAIVYDENIFNHSNETIKNYTYIIFAFAGALFIMLIIIISLLHSLKKKQKKINKFVEKQEAKIEATRKLNDVVSEVQKITEEEAKENKKKIEEQEDLMSLTTVLETVAKDREKKDEMLGLTTMLETVNEDQMSAKELKELKKKAAQNEQKEESEVEIKEIQIENTPVINALRDDTDEVYDLFEDDHKKKKKK